MSCLHRSAELGALGSWGMEGRGQPLLPEPLGGSTLASVSSPDDWPNAAAFSSLTPRQLLWGWGSRGLCPHLFLDPARHFGGHTMGHSIMAQGSTMLRQPIHFQTRSCITALVKRLRSFQFGSNHDMCEYNSSDCAPVILYPAQACQSYRPC